MTKEASAISGLLDRARRADPDALRELIPLVYAELRRLAAHYMQRERPDHSLQATALVHEAYLRLAGRSEKRWNNRQHFFAIAAEVMRNVLIDHARARLAVKRGAAGSRISLDEIPTLVAPRSADLLSLDEALTDLAAIDQRQARIVMLRYFAGMTTADVASVLEVSERTVLREWKVAKAWLYARMRRRQNDPSRGIVTTPRG